MTAAACGRFALIGTALLRTALGSLAAAFNALLPRDTEANGNGLLAVLDFAAISGIQFALFEQVHLLLHHTLLTCPLLFCAQSALPKATATASPACTT